jgi:thymidine kinase
MAPNETPPLGRLTVICGPMFTGKTTTLIDRLLSALGSGGSTVVAVKPSLDDRYHPTDLTTHDGRSLPATTIDRPEQLVGLAGDVIGLDEAHFFESGLHGPVMTLVGRGAHVLIAGLDRTSMNEPFGEMGLLLVEADEVVKLAGKCAVCGREAVHTVRLFDSTEPIVVGGPGMFENRCRAHLSAPGKSVDTE